MPPSSVAAMAQRGGFVLNEPMAMHSNDGMLQRGSSLRPMREQRRAKEAGAHQ